MINSDKVSYLFFNDQHKLLFFQKKIKLKQKKVIICKLILHIILLICFIFH